MELYQRVWAEKFTLTDEDKAAAKAGKQVLWQGYPVKHNGAERFHVLLDIADQHKPIYENQWLVKKDGQIEILWDDQVKSKYLFSLPSPAQEEAPRATSEALLRYLESKKAAEPAKETETPAAPEAVPGPVGAPDDPPAQEEAPTKPEPATIQNEFGQAETETHEGALIYEAPKNGDGKAPIIGEVDNQNE